MVPNFLFTELKKREFKEKDRIKGLLEEKQDNIVIITHVNPDGDAIGSSLALYRLLSNLGHHATVITPNVYPGFLAWMPGNESIVVFNNNQKKASQLLKEAEIIFSLDFNDLKRVKQFDVLVEQSNAYKVLIDHHSDPKDFASCVCSDTEVSSTCELLYDFIVELGYEKVIDQEIALCIFTGIMTDTGCFSYNSSNPYTYEIVKKLLLYGFNKDMAYYNVYDNFSADRMRLLGYVLDKKMEVFPEYRTAIINLTREEQKRYNFSPGDSEGFVNYPLSIKGIRFSVFFIEKEDHVKLSLRSKGNFAVNEFAREHFNGGGHFNASGGEYYATMEDTMAKFRRVLPHYANELNDYEI